MIACIFMYSEAIALPNSQPIKQMKGLINVGMPTAEIRVSLATRDCHNIYNTISYNGLKGV